MRTLALCFLTILLATGCGAGMAQTSADPAAPATEEPPARQPVAWASADWRTILPAGAQALVGLQVSRLLASPVVQQALEAMARVPSWQQEFQRVRGLRDACGLDPERDLRTAVFAVYGGDTPAIMAVIDGEFEAPAIASCLAGMAQGPGVETLEIGGYTIHGTASSQSDLLVSVPAPGLMIVSSDVGLLEEALVGEGERLGVVSSELSALVFSLPLDRPVWGAGVVPPNSPLEVALRHGLGNMASEPATAFFAHAEVRASLAVHGGAVMRSADDARHAAGWLREELGRMRIVFQAVGLEPLLRGLVLDHDGDRVTLNLAASVGDLEALWALMWTE